MSESDLITPAVPPTIPFDFFVEGIENNTNDCKGWHLRAERWSEHYTSHRADSLSYHVRFWNRWVFQKNVISNALYCLEGSLGSPDATVAAPRPWQHLTLVGHSNGCAVLCELLKQNPKVHCKTLHLIAGACDADFDKNGLNEIAARAQVSQIKVWVSDADSVLKNWATWSKKFLGGFGLGYGNLGYRGPQNVSLAARSVLQVIEKSGYGHSTYFDEKYFEDTMRLLTTDSGD